MKPYANLSRFPAPRAAWKRKTKASSLKINDEIRFETQPRYFDHRDITLWLNSFDVTSNVVIFFFSQRQCIEFALRAKPLKRYIPENRLQFHIWRVVTSQAFEYLIFAFIVCNTVVLMMQVYPTFIELRYSFGKSRTSSPKLSEERDPTLKIGAFCSKGIVVRKKSPPGLWYAVIISLGFNQKYPFDCVPLSEYHKLSLFFCILCCFLLLLVFFFIVQSTKFADFDPNSYLDCKEHSYVSLEVTSSVFPCTSIIKNLNFTQECWTVSTLVLQQFFSWSVYWSSSRLNQRLDKHIMLPVVLIRTLLRASCIIDCFVWYVSKSSTQCEEAVFW